MKHVKKIAIMTTLLAGSLVITACNEAPPAKAGIPPKLYTDSLFAVMNADRANYTKLIIQRLGPNGAGAIKPDEHWKEIENGALLPAQMFRAGSEAVAEVTDEFTYSLQSLWPINKQNAPKTPLEEEGLQYTVAVYPDVAVSPACTTCHNDHKDSPKTDFDIGDVMGGVVIRVPL